MVKAVFVPNRMMRINNSRRDSGEERLYGNGHRTLTHFFRVLLYLDQLQNR